MQRLLIQYGLFAHLFPQTHALLDSQYPVKALLELALKNTDMRIQETKTITPAFIFAVLLWFPMIARGAHFQAEGMEPLPALEKAMSEVITQQNQIISIPKRFTQVMREMWVMQYRFPKRLGNRAFNLLKHPRFRAAYDFLALRALAGDESMEVADWWTSFQDADETEQQRMVNAFANTLRNKPRRRGKPKSAT